MNSRAFSLCFFPKLPWSNEVVSRNGNIAWSLSQYTRCIQLNFCDIFIPIRENFGKDNAFMNGVARHKNNSVVGKICSNTTCEIIRDTSAQMMCEHCKFFRQTTLALLPVTHEDHWDVCGRNAKTWGGNKWQQSRSKQFLMHYATLSLLNWSPSQIYDAQKQSHTQESHKERKSNLPIKGPIPVTVVSGKQLLAYCRVLISTREYIKVE